MENVKDFLKGCICATFINNDIIFLYDKQLFRNYKINQILNKPYNIDINKLPTVLAIRHQDKTIITTLKNGDDFLMDEIREVFKDTKYKNYIIQCDDSIFVHKKFNIIKNILL